MTMSGSEWVKHFKPRNLKHSNPKRVNHQMLINQRLPLKGGFLSQTNHSTYLCRMTGVKSYLHKYVEQPGPKVVFGDDSTCITEGYGSIKCNVDEKRGTIFNSNKEIVMMAARVRDVYVLDMTSSAQEYCFFAKATENLTWLWHKRLAHLNFKTIKQLAK
ncbi:retrovirus-related pol polyprotein from transposon TNT 1-94 [Tanacetum coccineum]